MTPSHLPIPSKKIKKNFLAFTPVFGKWYQDSFFDLYDLLKPPNTHKKYKKKIEKNQL